ncbi:TrgA family protein [Loktanella agnita]|uniref:TrgA family protein n=1 Tax=Loktanella agnita TaxID=287097 RepID=UPI0039869DC9
MPTAGRLAGAIIFALFFWYIAGLMTPFFPEERPPSMLVPASVALGIFLGWRMVGGRAGHGYNAAIGIGLTAGASYAFWILFGMAFDQMWKNAWRRLYDGPMEAVADIFSLMIEYGQDFASFNLIANLLIGAVICAWVTEYFGQKYP